MYISKKEWNKLTKTQCAQINPPEVVFGPQSHEREHCLIQDKTKMKDQAKYKES